MNHFTIRKCAPSDAKVVRLIGERTFRETFAETNAAEDMEEYIRVAFSLQRIAEELAEPDSEFYLAECDGWAAGYMKINFPPTQTESGFDNSLEIQRLYISKRYKGMHIGSHLMQTAFASAHQAQADYVWLGVWEHNHAARAFYEHKGFKRFSEHTFILGSDKQTDYLMKAPVTDSAGLVSAE